MPGQGKRKRRQGARTAPDTGQWEAVLETRDQAELRAHVRRLQEEGVDASLLRIDTLCRRPPDRSTYRLSRFAAEPVARDGPEPR